MDLPHPGKNVATALPTGVPQNFLKKFPGVRAKCSDSESFSRHMESDILLISILEEASHDSISLSEIGSTYLSCFHHAQ